MARGEDGPTHEPVEQLATLRAIPGFNLVRPADANETAQAWLEILKRREAPVGPRPPPPQHTGGVGGAGAGRWEGVYWWWGEAPAAPPRLSSSPPAPRCNLPSPPAKPSALRTSTRASYQHRASSGLSSRMPRPASQFSPPPSRPASRSRRGSR